MVEPESLDSPLVLPESELPESDPPVVLPESVDPESVELELDEDDEALYHAVGPGTWRVEARINLDDLTDALGLEIETEEFDFETLGGLIFHLTGAVPAPGDVLLGVAGDVEHHLAAAGAVAADLTVHRGSPPPGRPSPGADR